MTAALVAALLTAVPPALAGPPPAFRAVPLPDRITGTRFGTVADVTGDGRLDVVAGTSTGLFVFPDAAGGGSAGDYYRAADESGYVGTIATTDFNLDGRVDVVIGGVLDISRPSQTRILRVFLGEADGWFRRVLELAGVYSEPHVGDFNGDGAPDFVRGFSEWYLDPNRGGQFRGVLESYLGDGAGGFGNPVRTTYQDPYGSGAIRWVDDFNGDGRDDVLLYRLAVVLADGSGGFGVPLPLVRPALPPEAIQEDGDPLLYDVAGGDLDGNGTRDLLMRFGYAVPDPDSPYGDRREYSWIYFGDGTGRFSAPVRLVEPPDHLRTSVRQLVGDVNGDGRDDVVFTGSYTFHYDSPLLGVHEPTDVYLATGPGTFSGPILSPESGGDFLGGFDGRRRLFDVDGDGHVDLVSEAYARGISVARGDGTGRFARADRLGAFDLSWGGGAAVGDFDGDERLDVAVANSGSYNVSVWRGDGTGGGWAGPRSYRVGTRETPSTIIAADLDADGRLDLATASHGELGAPAGVSILYGDGQGRFALGRQIQRTVPSALAAGDFDGDGRIDLAVAGRYYRTLYLYFDMPGATREVLLQDTTDGDGSAGHYVGLAAADLDGNGILDFVRTSVTPVMNVYWNAGDAGLRRIDRVEIGRQTNAVAAGDLDGDGHADVVLSVWDSGSRQGQALVLRGDGAGGFGAPVGFSVGTEVTPPNLAIADLDGAGQRAVVTDVQGLRILPAGPGGGLGPAQQFGPSGSLIRHIELADVNGDGLLDAVRSDAVFLNLGACGDGRVDGAEECDDGNTASCDGCSSICRVEPGAVCGDAVVSTVCGEECDDGPANSDTRADACRTTCRAPRCGDGQRDTAEQCDDGNAAGCDGCSPSCTIEPAPVCGDGVVNAGCGEECEDGNDVAGDGCADCRRELIPGSAPATTDCLTEWLVVNPANAPLYDRKGRISARQTCRDGDARCDFDGGAPGSCTFRVALCMSITDPGLPRCVPAAVASCEVLRPSLRDAERSPAAAALRATLYETGESLMAAAAGTCGAPLDVVVPVRVTTRGPRPGKLILRTAAATAAGTKDKDRLLFVCDP